MNIIIYLLVLTTAFSFSVIASNKNEISPINEVANKLVGSITTIANEELNNAQALGVFTKHYGNTKEVLKAIEDLTKNINVSKKYTEKEVDMLADKIINGGVGVWGDVPMSQHPGLDKENAKKMVKYILADRKSVV